jgi:predicted DNA-binding transcriptional regulator YafY
VLERRQLTFRYRARTSGSEGQRTVSPQRLTHYRENWYLDAFDHDRKALRSFAVDRITQPQVLDAVADDVAEAELDAHLAGSYGIFAGPPKAWATLVFSPRAARWVADEYWHSRQEGRFLADGRYELRVPYSNARELLMDVLRYGPDAEVAAPPALREEAKILLRLAAAQYEDRRP